MKIIPQIPVLTEDDQPVEIISTAGRIPGFPLIGFAGANHRVYHWSDEGEPKNPGDLRLVQAPITDKLCIIVSFSDEGRQITEYAGKIDDTEQVARKLEAVGRLGVTVITIDYTAPIGATVHLTAKADA